MTKNVRIELEARLLVDGKVEHQTDYDLQTELEFQAGRLLEPSWRAFNRHIDSQPDCDEDDRRLTGVECVYDEHSSLKKAGICRAKLMTFDEIKAAWQETRRRLYRVSP